jgi:hypothetical protein
MLKFIANLFGAKKPEAPIAETLYKVEAPVAKKAAPKAKKPAVKKATTRKPKAPKA